MGRLQLLRVEGVTLFELAALITPGEPAYPLLGRAMGEGIAHDVTLRLLLDLVVADRGSGLHCALDVTRLNDVLHLLRVVCPHAGEAVGLQFDADLERIGLALVHALPDRLNLIHDAEKLLHVMADLVRDHIGLGEIARRMETVLQLLVEGQVDIDLLVVRAIKRSHRRDTGAASGADAAAIEPERRVAVALAILLEESVPDVFGVGQHDRHELLQVVLARGLGVLDLRSLTLWYRESGLIRALSRQLNIRNAAVVRSALQDHRGIDTEEKHQAEDDQEADYPNAAPPASAATAREADAAPWEDETAATLIPPVFDIVALSFATPPHLPTSELTFRGHSAWAVVEHKTCRRRAFRVRRNVAKIGRGRPGKCLLSKGQSIRICQNTATRRDHAPLYPVVPSLGFTAFCVLRTSPGNPRAGALLFGARIPRLYAAMGDPKRPPSSIR